MQTSVTHHGQQQWLDHQAIAIETYQQCSCTADDITHTLELLLDNTSFTQFLEQSYQLGAALYTMGVHFCVARALMWNPQQYSCILQSAGPAAQDCKWNPFMRTLSTFLAGECVRKQLPLPHATTDGHSAWLLQELTAAVWHLSPIIEAAIAAPPLPATPPAVIDPADPPVQPKCSYNRHRCHLISDNNYSHANTEEKPYPPSHPSLPPLPVHNNVQHSDNPPLQRAEWQPDASHHNLAPAAINATNMSWRKRNQKRS